MAVVRSSPVIGEILLKMRRSRKFSIPVGPLNDLLASPHVWPTTYLFKLLLNPPCSRRRKLATRTSLILQTVTW